MVMRLASIPVLLALLAALAGAAVEASAQTALLAMTRDGRFLRVDPATGVVASVGSTGRSDVLALERGADGVYYAIADWNRLYAVDPANGRSALIATLPYVFVADLAAERGGRRLFAAADTDGAGEAETLVAIDPVRATSARIGPFDDPASEFDVPLFAFGLAFASDATLLGSLFAESPRDALVAPIDPTSGAPGEGVPVPGVLSGLDFGSDGRLYGLEQTAVGATSASFAVAIDPTSGVVTRLSSRPLGLEAAVGDCANGIDDDLDGALDGDDPGCQVWALDAGSAIPDCANRIDDDGDGLVDAADPGCSGPDDPSERAIGLACDDGLDNDRDGMVDATGSAGADPDPHCGGSPLGRESGARCGLGAEVALVLAAVRAGVSRARARAGRRP
jgi:hypothetical protein